ncbi:MAG TPA: ROK family protein [Verrucomicrobiae bacterium]|jgi:predicted NBD/HSP70 family sugar kinase|nr:ROK family protein [Verrucomicrobiae bacterium]
MNVLVIDVGGTHIKFRVWGKSARREIPSGKDMTPEKMAASVLDMTKTWKYEAISIGLPGPVIHGRAAGDPPNLGPGWVGFDFSKCFKKPVKIINDAAMQALGSYHGGRMLFIGLGTGLGSTLILDDVIVPLELGELMHRQTSVGQALGRKAADRDRRAWAKAVRIVVRSLAAAFRTDYIVIGGGNVRLLGRLPGPAQRGSNDKAFIGGARLWSGASITARARKHTWVIT